MENVRIPWNDWKVVKQLGKGSYGTVYEIERALGAYTEKAAMKVISIPLDHSAIEAAYVEGYDDESISRLYSNQLEQILDEYRNMEELSGYSNIVTCKDVSVIPHDNAFGWDIYIRMELLTPLMAYLKKNSDMDPEEVCRLGIDICNALELCEKREIVHRDVKPENIFVTKDGTFKLGDFGIARTLDHTTQATRAGTERYMAPEVIKREPYGKDVDLYSLGLVLYWLLNNRRMPFLNPNKVPVGDEPNVAQSRRLSGEALPRPVNGSEKLQDIVLKACEYDREKRYASAKEMLEALNHVSESLKTAPTILPEPVVEPAQESFSDHKTPIGDETQTDSWEEAKTVGKDFLDDNKESEYELLEEKTITPDWKDIKKEKEHNNYKKENDSNKQSDSDSETNDSSPNDEPIPVSESVAHKTNTKKLPLPIQWLIALILMVFAVGVAASFGLNFNTHSSSDSDSFSESSITIGGVSFQTITFGGIEWIVLDEEGDKTMLLSKDCIEENSYNNEYESVTWETCTLRSYLNAEWYEDTFSDDEKDMILTTNVVNSDNSEFGTSGGNDTEDKIFLLSIDEVKQYFSSDDERIAKYNGEDVWWWLRSPGDDVFYAAGVSSGGNVYDDGSSVDYDDSGIRPALWVNLNS